MDYKVIKSNRKTLVMAVERDGTVVIKAPKWTRNDRIESFYKTNLQWIAQRRKEHLENAARGTPPTPQQIKKLKKQARITLTQKTEHYASAMGVEFKNVKITSAKKRWGSCRKDGSICYSYRAMLLPEKCQDYIVVHELSHLKEFNHSKAFYEQIERVLPDYREIEREMAEFSNYDLY